MSPLTWARQGAAGRRFRGDALCTISQAASAETSYVRPHRFVGPAALVRVGQFPHLRPARTGVASTLGPARFVWLVRQVHGPHGPLTTGLSVIESSF